uniref:Alternative oxidase, mitochondrial-like n=1 Tax=Saccoglossus kowalevskii TaxID=10224 RepID=A0ABM0MV30_SACKO
AAYKSVQALRKSFDVLSGYKRGKPSEKKWLVRIIFLETVAGVPGMVAAMVRHLNSLRRMKRDHGWIHTLLEEAENERMHLMTALQEDAMMRDVIEVIRADEAHHRVVNHTLGSLDKDAKNPYGPGQ